MHALLPAPHPPRSLSPFLLDFGVIFGRSLGKVLFHQAPKGGDKGREAENLALLPAPRGVPARQAPTHPRAHRSCLA